MLTHNLLHARQDTLVYKPMQARNGADEMATTSTAPRLNERPAVAERLCISLRKLDQLIAEGEIRSLKIGKRRLVSEDSVAAFIKRQEKATNR